MLIWALVQMTGFLLTQRYLIALYLLPKENHQFLAVQDAALDDLYSLLMALLKEECLVSDPINANDKHKSKNDDKSRRKEQSTTTLYDLSGEMIQTTVAYFTPYYLVNHRHNFALYFSGATWYAKISEDSAGKILSQIAVNTNDNEIPSRLNTLHSTYEKVTRDELITGGPALADLISGIKGCELEEARIQSFWYDDIRLQRKRKHQTVRNSKELISVSEATRLIEGPASETRFRVIAKMIAEAYDELDGGSINHPEELKFTQRLKLYPYEYKDHVRTGILAKLLDKDKGDLVYWYETYTQQYVKSKQCWKRKKGYSVKVENLNLDEYKNLLLNKLKDSLEIAGFNMATLERELIEPNTISPTRTLME